jgi:hypothetical protein
MANSKINPANVADDLGFAKNQVSSEFNSVDEIMIRYAEIFINAAKKRIQEKGKVDTGNMSDIEFSTVQFSNGKWSISIGYDPNNPASKYYDYQNKGVKGIKSNSPNSMYAYRTLSVSPKMVEALMKWYMRHPNYIRNESQKTGLSKLQNKRKSIASKVSTKKNLRDLAESTAKRIKERGMKRIGFFEDNMKIFGKEFQKEVAVAMGTNIVVGIKQILEVKK